MRIMLITPIAEGTASNEVVLFVWVYEQRRTITIL